MVTFLWERPRHRLLFSCWEVAPASVFGDLSQCFPQKQHLSFRILTYFAFTSWEQAANFENPFYGEKYTQGLLHRSSSCKRMGWIITIHFHSLSSWLCLIVLTLLLTTPRPPPDLFTSSFVSIPRAKAFRLMSWKLLKQTFQLISKCPRFHSKYDFSLITSLFTFNSSCWNKQERSNLRCFMPQRQKGIDPFCLWKKGF